MTQWEIIETTPALPKVLVPIGYTGFHSILECPLRFSYSRDKNYPIKVHPKARMGTAFHDAIAFIAKRKKVTLYDAIQFFDNVLRDQRAEAMLNYREQRMSWPIQVREVMENALALKIRETNTTHSLHVRRHAETTLFSRDGLLVGRPDEVILTAGGPIIIDYKTGSFENEIITHFEDQIHFYAGLWYETHGEKPTFGRIDFVLDKYCHEFAIDTNRFESLLFKARKVASELDKTQWLFEAVLGKHCRFCDYRPWCQEYWIRRKLKDIHQSGDIDGIICDKHLRDSKSFCLQRDSLHIPIINKDYEPLPSWQSGTRIRALDLFGNATLRYRTEFSEIFRLTEKGDL